MAFFTNFADGGETQAAGNDDMTALPKRLDLDNPDFQKALELLTMTDANVFLTGKAGTGKSTFLRYICTHLRKNHVVLAPTGVAAVNVGGVTIHSFFQMPLRPVPPDDPEYSVRSLARGGRLSREKKKLIRELELIVIDEVSMVRCDMIDYIDRVLRAVRNRRHEPFGGVQLLLVGDVFQLEPVVTSDTRNVLSRYYPDFFFFNARVYNQVSLVSVELRKIYRQSDKSFIRMLDRFRVNRATDDDFRILNSRVRPFSSVVSDDSEGFGIVLTARRDTASAINSAHMDSLPSEEIVFEGEIEDDFPDNLLPTDLSLVLKKDAQVMLIRNDKGRRWVNGTLAKIREISERGITVELEDGRVEDVEKETWENIVYTYDDKERRVKEDVLGRFTQYPLKAAWALTIHKSQGLTFSRVTIDMGGGAFSAGQTYVALSRCRSLEGLCFINPLRKYDVIVNKDVAEFSRCFNNPDAISGALRRAEVKRLSLRAGDEFEDGEFSLLADTLWDIHSLDGCLGRESVRRLLGRRLSVITHLKAQLREKDARMRRLSDDFVRKGDAILSDGGDIDLAATYYESALSLDEHNERAELGTARCSLKRGGGKAAVRILDRIIRKEGECAYDARILKGDILRERKDLAGAALNYQAAAKLRSGNPLPILRLVESYEEAGMTETAEQWKEWLDTSGD